MVWYFCRGEVVAVTLGGWTSSVQTADRRTFGSWSNYSGDSVYALIPIEVECRKCMQKWADTLTLPPPVLSGEYRRGDAGG